MSRTPLNAFCALTMGQSPDSESYNIEHNGFPFYQGNADFGRIHPMVRVWCSAPKKLAKAGDILISVRAPIGALNIADCDCCIGRGLAAITPDATCADTMFLFYALYASAAELQRRGTGSTFKAISKNALSNLLLPSYCLEEQKEISAVLQQVDHLISLRQRQAEKLDELVKARFVEMFGEGKYVGNPLSNVCKLIMDGTHQPPQFVDAGIPFLLVSNLVHNEITYDTEKFISKESYQELIKRTPVEIGDILLSIVGSYGHAGVVRTDKPFCFQRHIAYIKPDFSKLNSEFLHHALLSDAVKYQMEKRVKGIAQKTLNLSELKKIVVPIPPLALQTEFSHFVHEVDREKERIQRSAALLETLKRSLMQQYFG